MHKKLINKDWKLSQKNKKALQKSLVYNFVNVGVRYEGTMF